MRTRRHHNNTGKGYIKLGLTTRSLERICKRLKVPFGEGEIIMTEDAKELMAGAISSDRDRNDSRYINKVKRAIQFVEGIKPLLIHEYLNYLEGKSPLIIKIVEAFKREGGEDQKIS